jgi:thiamine-monophosphate kinase
MTAMDVSDGLADDLSKLCLASGLAARIYADRVPVHPYLRQAFPDNFLDSALNGGEDYILLFTAPEDTVKDVLVRLPDGAATLGEIVDGRPGQVTLVGSNGEETVVSRAGWDHFG